MPIISLDSRKQDLLKALVREYVKTAQPVGSSTLVQNYGFDLSSATIRNEMADLEDKGLITQPHISAGRIPTEKGFRYFVDLVIKDLKGKKPGRVQLPAEKTDKEDLFKAVAKQIAQSAKAAVIVAFGKQHVYYTGLSYLFSQPEFREFSRVVRFSELIDRLDDIVGSVFKRVSDETDIWIGNENPFGNQCGSVVSSCSVGKKEKVAVCVLGPIRMDYEQSYALINTAKEVLKEKFN